MCGLAQTMIRKEIPQRAAHTASAVALPYSYTRMVLRMVVKDKEGSLGIYSGRGKDAKALQ